MSSIASGLTQPDPSAFYDAYNILLKFDLWKQAGSGIKQHIQNGISGKSAETPKPGNPLFANTFTKIIANNSMALNAARKKAEQSGYYTEILTSRLTGNTEKAARDFVQHIINCKINTASCFLQGGETTLNVTGYGKGGRNQHFALCALHELLKCKNNLAKHITIFSAGTDGTEAAGAIIDSDMLKKGVIDITHPGQGGKTLL
jgi:glycerate 2-kinase